MACDSGCVCLAGLLTPICQGPALEASACLGWESAVPRALCWAQGRGSLQGGHLRLVGVDRCYTEFRTSE